MPQVLLTPSPRVLEVLSSIGGLEPAQAQQLLDGVTPTLNPAELYVLQQYLPPAVGPATVMNTDPMPWEKTPTTQEIIAVTLGPSPKKPWVVAATALALTALTVILAWPSAPDLPVALPAAPPPAVAKAAPLPPAPAPAPPAAKRVKKTKAAKSAAPTHR